MNPRDIHTRVADALRTAGPRPWLVGYDANGIQEIITACGRPISMRGASETITRFDSNALDDPRTIFAGGGRGICLAGSESEARGLASQFIDTFQSMTEYGVMAACAVPFERSKEAQSIRWLRHRLEIEKDAARTPTPELPTQKELECPYCRQYPARIPHMRDGREERVCKRCHKMIQAGRKEREMKHSLAEFDEDGRIAAVSADGNNLGALFESLCTLDELAATSEAIKVIFARAHEQALDRVPEDKRIPLMTGGDDVRAFLPPSKLLDYVDTLAQAVTAEARTMVGAVGELLSPATRTRLTGLGVGIGAVIADVYFPAWRLMDYAHELERNAKAKAAAHGSRDSQGGGSVFDFAVIRSEASMTVDIEHTRAKRDVRPLFMDADRWSKTIKKARALAEMPSAQLDILAAEHTMSVEEFGNMFRYYVARSPNWQKWYDDCGVDWRDSAAMLAGRPDRGLLDLMALWRMSRKKS